MMIIIERFYWKKYFNFLAVLQLPIPSTRQSKICSMIILLELLIKLYTLLRWSWIKLLGMMLMVASTQYHRWHFMYQTIAYAFTNFFPSSRLIFPYLVCLLMLQLIIKYFYDHSIVEIPSQDHITCQENMWKNMLFIDTFFPIHERVSSCPWRYHKNY